MPEAGQAGGSAGMAIEPMTCPPNAFVTGDDLLIIKPGEAVTHS